MLHYVASYIGLHSLPITLLQVSQYEWVMEKEKLLVLQFKNLPSRNLPAQPQQKEMPLVSLPKLLSDQMWPNHVHLQHYLQKM